MKLAGVIAQFVLPALVAVAIMTAGERIIGTDPVESPVTPTGFVWADRVFTSEKAFDGWLRSRGSTYEQWATRHPTAAATVERRTATKLPSKTASAVPVAVRSTDMLLLTLGVGGFVALALALALVLRHLRIAVLRPLPTLASGRGVLSAFASSTVTVAGAKSRRRRVSIGRRQPSAEKSVLIRVAVWARALNAGQSLPRLVRIRYWLFRVHYEHPDLAWYAVALTFAAVVGLLVPLLGR